MVHPHYQVYQERKDNKNLDKEEHDFASVNFWLCSERQYFLIYDIKEEGNRVLFLLAP